MKRLFVTILLAELFGGIATGMGLQRQFSDGVPEYDSVLCVLESEMASIARGILYGDSDSARLSANQDFSQRLLQVLEQKGSFEYKFDSLVTISRLYSPDSIFRIFTWNLPRDDGTYIYFGFIQCKAPIQNESLFILSDRSDSMDDIEHQITDNQYWPGAHYYQIIFNESPTGSYYTLLGWDGHTRSTTRKIIDILTFDQEGRPVFGAPIFPDYKQGDQTRVIFEYSSNATISLKYELQNYLALRNKNPYRPKYKSITTRMIVFDHLEPMAPSLVGQYSFYIPAGNIFDAFIFKDGCWRFQADVDARNPDIPQERNVNQPIEYQLFPPGEKK